MLTYTPIGSAANIHTPCLITPYTLQQQPNFAAQTAWINE